MMRSDCGPLEQCFGFRGGVDDLLWHMELNPHTSGDFSITVVQANSSLKDQGLTSPSPALFGVFDGHGGPEVSHFVNNHLFPCIHQFVSEQGGLSVEVIRKTFVATEEEFLHLV